MQLFSKGPRYPENRIPAYLQVKESIIIGITSCIQPWCDKHGVTTLPFFDENISDLSTNGKTQKHVKTKS